MTEKPLRLRFWRHPAVVAIIGATIAGLFGVVVAIVEQQNGTPATGTSSSTVPPRGYAVTSHPDPQNQTSSETPTAVGGGVRNRGPLTLASGGVADLDSLAKNWGGPDVTLNVIDLRLWDAGQNTEIDGGIPYTSFLILDPDSLDAYSSCADGTGYNHAIRGADIVPGLKFCVLTSEKRYAFVQVTDCTPKRGDNGLQEASFAVTVWNQTVG